MSPRLLARRASPLARHTALALALLSLGACSSTTGPAGHPLAGAWRGSAVFSPSSLAYRRSEAEVALTVAEDGAVAGSLRTGDGESAAVAGEVGRDGALTVRFGRFTVDGRLHRAPRERATGSGVQRDAGAEIGVVTLALARR